MSCLENESMNVASCSSAIHRCLSMQVREAREKCGLTQEELAEIVGVSPDTIKRYESGKAKGMRLDTALCIARALGLSLDAMGPKSH